MRENIDSDVQSLPFCSGFALQKYLCAEQGIAEANKNHYQYWYIDGSLDSEKPENWEANRISLMQESIKKFQVKPIFHGNFKVPLASDVNELRYAAIEYTKKEIDIASKLGAPLIIHGSVVVEPRLIKEVKKRALENYVDSISVLYNYAQFKKVNIYLENLSNYQNYRPFHYIFTTEEEIDYVLKSTSLSLFFDIGHANIGNKDPLQIFEKFHDRIAGVSMSNNNGCQDQHLGFNKGTINYINVISVMLKCSWHGIIGIEVRDRSPYRCIQDVFELYSEASSSCSSIL